MRFRVKGKYLFSGNRNVLVWENSTGLNRAGKVLEIEFLVTSTGETSTAGHYGKAVKGKFIRYLALNQIKSIDEFEGFSYDGFNWDGKAFVKEK